MSPERKRTRAKTRNRGTPPAASAPEPRTEKAERHQRIAVAAYYRAEKRGFTPGGAEQDWLEAERELAQTAPPP